MLRLSVVSLCLASSTFAFAQGADQPAGDEVVAAATDPAAAPAGDLNTASTAAPEPAPAATPSTSGLRNGFSLSAGQEFGGDRDISGTMFGVDWRIG